MLRIKYNFILYPSRKQKRTGNINFLTILNEIYTLYVIGFLGVSFYSRVTQYVFSITIFMRCGAINLFLIQLTNYPALGIFHTKVKKKSCVQLISVQSIYMHISLVLELVSEIYWTIPIEHTLHSLLNCRNTKTNQKQIV